MKVLLIDVICKGGSTGDLVYSLYSQINSDGGEAAVCYGRGKHIKEKNIFKFSMGWETLAHAFLTRITGYTGGFSFFSTRRLIGFIKRFKPDVVHIHELHAYYVNIYKLLDYLKKINVKVIHTLHCSFSYTGKCGIHYDCEKWKTCCDKCPRLNEYVSTLFFDRTKRMFLKKKKAFEGFKNLTIVCPSNWLANNAKQSFLNKYPIKVLYNGIDTATFYQRDVTEFKKGFLRNGEKMVLAVAPNLMSENKGGRWVLKLAELMKDNNVRFVLVGLDDVNVPHPNNVVLLGRIYDKNKLAKLYSMADVFIICSKSENFPTTCLEAQCCGTPICGFDVGGVKETSVIDEQEAFVAYGDILSLKDYIIKRISSKPAGLSKMAIEKFSKKTFYQKTKELYES